VVVPALAERRAARAAAATCRGSWAFGQLVARFGEVGPGADHDRGDDREESEGLCEAQP